MWEAGAQGRKRKSLAFERPSERRFTLPPRRPEARVPLGPDLLVSHQSLAKSGLGPSEAGEIRASRVTALLFPGAPT
jgi:hypothetical protein